MLGDPLPARGLRKPALRGSTASGHYVAFARDRNDRWPRAQRVLPERRTNFPLV